MRSQGVTNRAVIHAIAFLGMAVSLSAQATPCAVLQYDEMKDMKVEELAKEYCTTEVRAVEMLDESIASLRGRQDEAANELRNTQIGQCRNEQERIGRVLSRVSSVPAQDLWKKFCKKA